MGQVALDLPDPMQNAGPVGPGVDDLLAQLAGEEIDRLLAEADVERPATTAQVVTPPADFAPVPPPQTEVNTAAIAPTAADPAKVANLEPPPQLKATAPIAEADVEELDARVAKELNTLFTELDSEKPAVTTSQAPAAPAAAPTPEDLVSAAVAATPAPPADPLAHAQELEKQVLGQTLLDALAGPIEMPTPASRFKSLNLSFLLRPLEWVNAPLNAFSDTVREALGKVAIMTLINALAILIYVMFLRKH